MLHTCVLALVIGATPAGIDGIWEGELEEAPRPYVLALDFDRKVARLDAARDTEYPLLGFELRDGGVIRFSLQLANTLVFELRREGAVLRGQATAAGEPTSRVWAERLPVLAAPKDRGEAWQQDLDAFTHRFLRYDRSYAKRDAATARARLAALRRSVPRLTDHQITAELARIAALSRNAHTRLYLVRNRVELRRLPIRVWWFGDALHVVSVREDWQQLLGCRVARIGTMDVATAARRVAPLYAGTASWQRYLSSYTLMTPELLAGTGVTADAEKIPVTLRCGERTVDTVLLPLPLERSREQVEAWWDLAPQRTRDGWRHVLAASKEGLPLALRHPDVNYWHERLDEGRTVYVQYTRSEEQPGRPFDAFARAVLAAARDPATARVIVDLRFNTGGNLDVADPLFTELKATRPRLVVLTGRATFSAAMSHLARLRERPDTRQLGEPIADDGDFWSEGGNVKLPNSGYDAHYANARHCYARGARSWKGCYATFEPVSLTPQRVIEWTFDAYLRGEDPVLAAALRE